MDFEQKRRYYQECDPTEPLAAEDERYEPFDKHGLRGEIRAAVRLLDTIRLSDQPSTLLFTGLLGSGKSTELRQFAAMARQFGYFVAYRNVLGSKREKHRALLDRSQLIGPADVLSAICLTIDEAIHGATKSYPFEDLLARMWETLRSKIKIEGLDVGTSAAQLKLKFQEDATFREKLNRSLDDGSSSFREGVEAFIEDAATEIGKGGLGHGLIVVLDGLEKMAESEVRREEKEEAVRELFLQRSEIIRLPCHVILPISPFMIQYGHELGGLYPAEPVVLPMVRVFKYRSDEPDPAGVQAMVSALGRRLDIKEAFSSLQIVEDFAIRSGGVMRDMLRFARQALLGCEDANAVITERIADRAVRSIQRSYHQGLFEEYQLPLRKTRVSKDFSISERTRRYLSPLLRGHMLLRYHNEAEWYDAHPLLWQYLSESKP